MSGTGRPGWLEWFLRNFESGSFEFVRWNLEQLRHTELGLRFLRLVMERAGEQDKTVEEFLRLDRMYMPLESEDMVQVELTLEDLFSTGILTAAERGGTTYLFLGEEKLLDPVEYAMLYKVAGFSHTILKHIGLDNVKVSSIVVESEELKLDLEVDGAQVDLIIKRFPPFKTTINLRRYPSESLVVASWEFSRLSRTHIRRLGTYVKFMELLVDEAIGNVERLLAELGSKTHGWVSVELAIIDGRVSDLRISCPARFPGFQGEQYSGSVTINYSRDEAPCIPTVTYFGERKCYGAAFSRHAEKIYEVLRASNDGTVFFDLEKSFHRLFELRSYVKVPGLSQPGRVVEDIVRGRKVFLHALAAASRVSEDLSTLARLAEKVSELKQEEVLELLSIMIAALNLSNAPEKVLDELLSALRTVANIVGMENVAMVYCYSEAFKAIDAGHLALIDGRPVYKNLDLESLVPEEAKPWIRRGVGLLMELHQSIDKLRIVSQSSSVSGERKISNEV